MSVYAQCDLHKFVHSNLTAACLTAAVLTTSLLRFVVIEEKVSSTVGLIIESLNLCHPANKLNIRIWQFGFNRWSWTDLRFIIDTLIPAFFPSVNLFKEQNVKLSNSPKTYSVAADFGPQLFFSVIFFD